MMNQRPVLIIGLNSRIFREYYYLKEELMAFCRNVGLPVSGGKHELSERVAYFLDTGKCLVAETAYKKKTVAGDITLENKIGEDFVCSELHRAFFREVIGTSFSFTVAFQRWLKSHPGNTFNDAVDAWYELKKEKKPMEIDKQFEYNTYIRDFFNDNAGKSLPEAICCWKYKKSLPGIHKYHRNDLSALLKS